MERKEKNAKIFQETEELYTTDPMLKRSIRQSIEGQLFISDEATINIPKSQKAKKANIIVSKKRSLEAAEKYAKQGKKVCVLNFASAKTPGGGVVNGASAQEECICRCSTLYPCLNTEAMWDLFYKPHRDNGNALHNDDCIYTPDVCVFKSDTDFPELISETSWWNVNVLTCAAPKIREKNGDIVVFGDRNHPEKITLHEFEQVLAVRIRRIFEIAVLNGNEVIVLGAFGCGAFKNPPEIVAKVFNAVMQDYICYFDEIEYAVFHTENEIENYNAFYNEIYCANN